jgi:hypothetical protein
VKTLIELLGHEDPRLHASSEAGAMLSERSRTRNYFPTGISSTAPGNLARPCRKELRVVHASTTLALHRGVAKRHSSSLLTFIKNNFQSRFGFKLAFVKTALTWPIKDQKDRTI